MAIYLKKKVYIFGRCKSIHVYVFCVSPFLFDFIIIIITAQGCSRSNMFVHFLKILVLFLNKGLEMNAFLVFVLLSDSSINRKNNRQINRLLK